MVFSHEQRRRPGLSFQQTGKRMCAYAILHQLYVSTCMYDDRQAIGGEQNLKAQTGQSQKERHEKLELHKGTLIHIYS